MKKIIKYTLLIIVGAGAFWLANLIWFRPFNINYFYEKIFIEFALKNPELLSTMRILEPMGLNFHNDDLNDGSDAFAHEMNNLINNDLNSLRKYDRSSLSESQKLSYDILEWFLQDQVEGEKFMYHNYPLNQLGGVQSQLPSFMASIHYIGNKKDAEYYIARLSKFGIRFDQELEGLRIREEKKIIPPKFVIEKVLTEMRNFTSQKPKENILFTSFEEKLKSFPTLMIQTNQNCMQTLNIKLTIRFIQHTKNLLHTLSNLSLRPRLMMECGNLQMVMHITATC